MRPTQDIAVGVAKLKEQMSNPMFPASKNLTHARRPKQQNEQEVGCLNIDFKESAGSRRRHVVFYQCMYPIAEPGAHMLWDGTASGGGMTRRCLK